MLILDFLFRLKFAVQVVSGCHSFFLLRTPCTFWVWETMASSLHDFYSFIPLNIILAHYLFLWLLFGTCKSSLFCFHIPLNFFGPFKFIFFYSPIYFPHIDHPVHCFPLYLYLIFSSSQCGISAPPSQWDFINECSLFLEFLFGLFSDPPALFKNNSLIFSLWPFLFLL